MNIKETLQQLLKTTPQKAWHHTLRKLPEFWDATKDLPEDFTIAERAYFILHDLTLDDIKCKECHKNLVRFGNTFKEGFRDFCSVKCARNSKLTQDKQKKTCIERYGVENPRQSKKISDKIESTNLKKYGSRSPFGSKEVNKKLRETFKKNHPGITSPFQLESSKQTILERFGTDNAAKAQEIKEKMKNTCEERYGGNAPAVSEIVKEKMKNTCLEKYNSTSPLNSKECRSKGYETIRNKNYENLKEDLKSAKFISLLMTKEEFTKLSDGVVHLKCNICDREFTSQFTNFQRIKCGCLNKAFSYAEIEIIEFIEQFTSNIEQGRFDIIPPYQIDIYLPDFNLAIEYDGIYWHSTAAPEPKGPVYHLHKTELCEFKGIKLIHIFENEWVNNKELIEDIIRGNLTGNPPLIFSSEFEIDRRYNTKSEILSNNYNILETLKPKIGFYNKNTLEKQITEENSWRVYDCGAFKISVK